jgi:hypothetical protein
VSPGGHDLPMQACQQQVRSAAYSGRRRDRGKGWLRTNPFMVGLNDGRSEMSRRRSAVAADKLLEKAVAAKAQYPENPACLRLDLGVVATRGAAAPAPGGEQ